MKLQFQTRRFVVAWLILEISCATARADGGTLRLRKRRGPFEIAVFTAPTPVRVGVVDISVLVQDSTTGEPLPEARVTFAVWPEGRPRAALRQPASAKVATNRLLQAALIPLSEPGRWVVEVAVGRASAEEKEVVRVAFALDVAEALPRWVTLWPWIAWPFGVVFFFGLHQWVIRRSIASTSAK